LLYIRNHYLHLDIHFLTQNPKTMTDKQSNELSMSNAVQQVLNVNSAIVQSIPAFQTAKNELDSELSRINDAAQAQTKKITGSAEDKQKAGKEAIDMALALIGPAKSYARTTENQTMFQAINYTHSDFQRMRYTATVSTLKVIRDTIQANAAALADYGITAALIGDFTNLINVYSGLTLAPRGAITAKSVATKTLAASFKEVRAIIKRLDGFVEAKKKSDTGFYNAYKSARVIINNRGKSKKSAEATAASAKKAMPTGRQAA
jgi:hypothetical protein